MPSEIIPLAVQRAGGLAWEYYFHFDGGRPPWVSAMAQGTALEALARAYEAFNDPSYLTTGAEALSLFTAGNAEAEAEVPHFNTGFWSLYQPGDEDPLSYHELVTGFLQELCTRTQASVYCTTARDFQTDLTTPPALTLKTHHSRVGVLTDVHFWLSKESHVGIVEVFDGTTIFATSAELGDGSNTFGLPVPRHPGAYTVRLAATDLAGNFNRIVGTIDVAPAGKPRPAKPY